MDSLFLQRDYLLVIKDRADYAIYKYIYPLDSTKNMIWRFDKEADQLQSGPFKFKRNLLKNLVMEDITSGNFYQYKDESIGSHTNCPIWFNETYGILSSGFLVNEFYYLPEGVKEKDLDEILKILKAKTCYNNGYN